MSGVKKLLNEMRPVLADTHHVGLVRDYLIVYEIEDKPQVVAGIATRWLSTSSLSIPPSLERVCESTEDPAPPCGGGTV